MIPISTAADPVIRVTGLRKHYGETRAVDGVSFEVPAGTVFGLLGPNGAGKTTTVEVLEGLRTPDAGEVRVLGIDAVQHPADLKPRIGVSLQTAALYPKLTVVEVLDLFRSFYPKGRPSDELIGLMDLDEKRSTRTQDLSGGQRQRLSVALALVNDPELVFLDEPTSGTFFPIDAMPDALKTVARALPLTYLGDGLRQVMVDGTPFAPLWVCFAFLAVWLAICFGIAARFFKWQ